MTSDRATLESLIGQITSDPVATARFASVLLAKREFKRAKELLERAVTLAPENGEVRLRAAELLSHDMPYRYSGKVSEVVPYAEYEAAFRKWIRPGDLVLDLGAGTGVLAMLAARAGGRVITCDTNVQVADAVSEVVAHNSLADRVRVLPKRPSDLEIGADLEAPADVVIWGNLANDLIGGGVFETVEDALKKLSRHDARVIPARGRIRIALAEDLEAFRWHMGTVEGFDLSAFNRLSQPRFVAPSADRIAVRGDSADLFTFDLQSAGPPTEKRASASLTSRGGRVDGVAQWMALAIDDDSDVESSTRPPASFHRFANSVETSPGDSLTVSGSLDGAGLRIWAAHQSPDGTVGQR